VPAGLHIGDAEHWRLLMAYILKKFGELSATELHDIYKLRAQVFVVEQKCAYQDVDGKDPYAFHLMLIKDEKLCGYLRILPPGLSYKEVSIGRVVVLPELRGRGLGVQLMKQALVSVTGIYGQTAIVISAQCYLQKWYEALGFVSEGESYLEDEIPHVKMKKQLKINN
jgi:ElaA protein